MAKIYNKFEKSWLQWLVSWMPVAIGMHWTMQGILYADPAERRFRIAVDALLTAVGFLVLRIWFPWMLALPIAFVIAHTINFLTNAQLCALARDFGLVNVTADKFARHIQGIHERAQQESSVKSVMVCGGLGHKHLHDGSDFDARIIRHPGMLNGFRAALFLAGERSRALANWFPLDMYLFDSETSLKTKLKPSEPISVLSQEIIDDLRTLKKN